VFLYFGILDGEVLVVTDFVLGWSSDHVVSSRRTLSYHD